MATSPRSPDHPVRSPDHPVPPPDHSENRTSVSTVQIGASAAAAVTSALAASFFGVAGTLIGAAVGSIVSTIAGALYADYLKRAGRRLRGTTSVVIQRIPAEVLATTPFRHLTGPTDLPGEKSMRPVGDETSDEAVAVPLAARSDLIDELDAASSAIGSTPPAGRPWWKRPMLPLAAIGLAGFLIALGVITAAEGAIGHPVSGGSSGFSIGGHRTQSKAGSTSTPTATPAAATPTGSATPSPSTTAAVTPTEQSSTAPTAATTSAAPSSAAATDPAATAASSPAATN